MSRTMFRYVATLFLQWFAVILVCALAIFLVADFVDRAKIYTGPNWLADVAVLYGHKALLAIQQLGPAAMLLAAGITVSSLARRGELTALRALTFGPSSLYLPVAVCALAICLGMAAFDEKVLIHSSRRVDEITAVRFNRWGDWRFYFTPKQWFRLGDRIFFLRGGNAELGYEDVSILTLNSDFEIASRMDAQRMTHVEGTRWKLSGMSQRTFGRGESRWTQENETIQDLGAGATAFQVRPGRPEQMAYADLKKQIGVRERVGLPTPIFRLVMHNRLAYPMAGLPAALLAIGVALRPGRKGHLTVAMVEGIAVSMSLWGLMVVCKALVLAGHLGPALAAWLPTAILLSGALCLWLWWEGMFTWIRNNRTNAG